ncbi:hypothetical protein KQI61_04500 [Anaerocolumna aminovalerica]|uniref:hypothetical protein n=1 Tax=Anaerocolumna aminovalerica TaxID=1527 RepID=UPI001C0F279B|nr:hypothetical protein [Anaerocolumna aminovalerica]MBU5331448.1 hypothetical protein [Anaerocolumna aminovalerica]
MIGTLMIILFAVYYFTRNSKLYSVNSNNNKSDTKAESKVLVKSLKTKVVGVTFNSAFDPDVSRQEIIKDFVSLKTPIYLKPHIYEGEPANYVVLSRKGMDIGNLKAELSKELATKYKDCTYEVEITALTGDDERTVGCNILLNIYKSA